MDRYNKLNLLLIIILAVGVLYLGTEVHRLGGRMEKMGESIVEVDLVIYNGTAERRSSVKVTEGATALEALRREASVVTESHHGIGEMILSVDGVGNNFDENKFWLIGLRDGGDEEWRAAETGAGDIRLGDDQEVLFWYGESQEAPFNVEP